MSRGLVLYLVAVLAAGLLSYAAGYDHGRRRATRLLAPLIERLQDELWEEKQKNEPPRVRIKVDMVKPPRSGKGIE